MSSTDLPEPAVPPAPPAGGGLVSRAIPPAPVDHRPSALVGSVVFNVFGLMLAGVGWAVGLRLWDQTPQAFLIGPVAILVGVAAKYGLRFGVAVVADRLTEPGIEIHAGRKMGLVRWEDVQRLAVTQDGIALTTVPGVVVPGRLRDGTILLPGGHDPQARLAEIIGYGARVMAYREAQRALPPPD